MRIKPLALTLAAIVLAVASPALAEKSGGKTGGDGQGTFVVHQDGSVEVDGLYYGDMLEFQLSDEFKKGGHRCASPGADELVELVAAKNPADCSINSTTIQAEYAPANGPVYTIPVVFHVIQRTDGVGNIANSLITSQVAILNEDFRALAGSLGAPGFDTEIQFALATVDPNGNATTGINRVTNNSYFADPGPGAANPMKQALRWDTTRYLNIYTNDAAGNLGYATFPQQDAGSSLDGVVLLYSSVGRNSPGGGIYNQGRTGTHEVGHYLGLFHTFQDGCGTASAPYTTGDRIADTNRQQSPNFDCPAGATSCSSPDPIENYMNYTQDTCMNRFTSEQANRMRCAIANYRETLVGGGGGPGPGPVALSNGVPVTGLAASTGTETFYTLAVPSGASNLVIQIAGGSGDADLYVRQGSPPTQSTWTCRPYLGGNNETCTFASPAAGTWHVMLHAYSGYSGVSLTGSFSTGPVAPCTGCDHYSGTLTGSGNAQIQPNGTYYQSTVAGMQRGWLIGPTSADFDLELYRWNGSSWTKVAQSISSTSTETIAYNGTAGYYYWRILSYSGSGAYNFWIDPP